MDAENVAKLKGRCEDWLKECIICKSCGKLPESLWKYDCDHIFCGSCKKSLKKCYVCSVTFARRSKKNKGVRQEHIYDNLIEAANELIASLKIDVSSLGESIKIANENKEVVIDVKATRKVKEPVSSKKQTKVAIEKNNVPRTPEKESKVNIRISVDQIKNEKKKVSKNESTRSKAAKDSTDDEADEEPEGKFGRRKYSGKKSVVESPKTTPKNKSEQLFERITGPERFAEKPKAIPKQMSRKLKTTKVDVASSEDDNSDNDNDSGDDEVIEVPKSRRNRKVVQKSTPKSKPDVARVRERPPRRCAAAASATDTTESKNVFKKPQTPSPKKRKLNTSKEPDKTVYDFDVIDEEEKEKKPTKNQEKVLNKRESSKADIDNKIESVRRGSSRQRTSTKSTDSSVKPRNSSPKNSIVMIATSLSKDQYDELAKFSKKFHCTIKEAYDTDVTHVICRTLQDNYTSRTIKYLHGLVGNKWLLSYDWIDDSLREGEILDEETYEVRGTCKDKEASNGAPEKSRTSKVKLFKEYTAYFEGKFVPQNIPPKEDLVKLFKSAGGNVVDTTTKLNAIRKKEQKLIVVREDDQQASTATQSLKSINVAEFLSMITEFNVNDDLVNFA